MNFRETGMNFGEITKKIPKITRKNTISRFFDGQALRVQRIIHNSRAVIL